MANKVIKSNSKKAQPINTSEAELRRLNAHLNTQDIQSDTLAHYGVIGQKWGIRNESSRSVRSSRVKMARNRRTLSDEELKKTVERIQMEKKLKDLVAEDSAPAAVYINRSLQSFMGGVIGAAAGATGAVIVKEVLKAKGITTAAGGG